MAAYDKGERGESTIDRRIPDNCLGISSWHESSTFLGFASAMRVLLWARMSYCHSRMIDIYNQVMDQPHYRWLI